MNNNLEKIIDFKIPIEEHYRYRPYEKDRYFLKRNVYKDYNSSMITDMKRSMSERLFERYCENNSRVKYIYKNGDSGSQYLSIVYGGRYGREKLFYPDYIVQLENDDILIIETKGGESYGQSKNIDKQVENKFKALKRFAEEQNYNFAFVRDRDQLLYFNNTEYSEEMNNNSWKLLEEFF